MQCVSFRFHDYIRTWMVVDKERGEANNNESGSVQVRKNRLPTPSDHPVLRCYSEPLCQLFPACLSLEVGRGNFHL